MKVAAFNMRIPVLVPVKSRSSRLNWIVGPGPGKIEIISPGPGQVTFFHPGPGQAWNHVPVDYCELERDNCPKLMNQLISHLLWADDLILLALDPKTLQKQLHTLNNFCLEWGVEINANKTKLMKFNALFDNYQPFPSKLVTTC